MYHPDGRIFIGGTKNGPSEISFNFHIVDDVCTTGSSFREAKVASEKEGLTIVNLVCVLDRRLDPTEPIGGLQVRSLMAFTEPPELEATDA